MARVLVRALMRKNGVVAYSFVTEAWKSLQKDDKPHVPPSEDPERQEMVIAIASNGKETAYRAWVMQRDWNEQLIALEEIEFESGELTSWMADMLS